MIKERDQRVRRKETYIHENGEKEVSANRRDLVRSFKREREGT